MFRIEKNQRWKPGRAFWTAALLLIVFVVAQTISLLHIYWTYGISSYSSNIAYVHSSLDTASSVTTAPSLSSSYSSYVNRFSLLHQSFKSAFPRICYYNQHPGTASDFGHAVKSLGLDTPSFFNSKLLTDYGQSNKHADELLDNGMGDFFCDSFDIVVSGDTTPDVRFLMKRIDLSPDIDDVRPDVAQLRPCRLSKLVVQVTNRFDLGTWDIGFYEGYYTLIRRLAQRKDQKVQWVVNNPWEPRYMEFKMGQMVVNVSSVEEVLSRIRPILNKLIHLFLKTTLIRPLGVSPVPAKSVSDAERGKAAFAWHPDIAGFTSLIEKHQLSDLITILPREYGGPATLAQYKAFVTVPYQSSTMKVRRIIAT